MQRILFALLLAVTSAAVAQQQSPADAAMARMRDALKKQNERIAQAEAAAAEAQAKQLAAETKGKELEGQIATLKNNLKTETEQRKAENETSDTNIKNLQTKLATAEKGLADQIATNLQWKAHAEKATKVATAKEGERADAEAKAIILQRQVEAHERKNREMYKLGTEILERYKSFGLGTALLAKEPFTGSMRVKFQNYVNDYGDKLATQRIGAAKVGGVGEKTTEPPKKP